MLTDGLLIATGFTGALTLAWLIRVVMRVFTAGPPVAVHFGEKAAETLTKEMGKARREVLFLGILTTPALALALAQTRSRKTTLDILLDPEADDSHLTKQAIQPRRASRSTPPGLLAIIDDRTVIVASEGANGDVGQVVIIRAEAALVQACRQQFAAYHPAGQAVAPPAPVPTPKPVSAPVPMPPRPAPAPAATVEPVPAPVQHKPAPAPMADPTPAPAREIPPVVAPVVSPAPRPAPAPVKFEMPAPAPVPATPIVEPTIPVTPKMAPVAANIEPSLPEMEEEELPPPTPPVRLDFPMHQSSIPGIRVEQQPPAVSMPSYTAPEDDPPLPSYTDPEAELPPSSSPVDDLLAAVARASYASTPEEEAEEEPSAPPMMRSTADLFARLRREVAAAGEDDSNEKAG